VNIENTQHNGPNQDGRQADDCEIFNQPEWLDSIIQKYFLHGVIRVEDAFS
jgi:hypothetical protein